MSLGYLKTAAHEWHLRLSGTSLMLSNFYLRVGSVIPSAFQMSTII